MTHSLFNVLLLTWTCWTRVELCLRTRSSHKNVVHDKGFEELFRTNTEEMENVPIHFDKPIPRWITGTLIRNGPGQFEVGNRRFSHMFDGFGKLYSWRFIGNGSVFFSTKFIKSDFYSKSISQKDISPYVLFGPTHPRFNHLQVLLALWRSMDNMNVNIFRFPSQRNKDGDFVSLNDIWDNYEINPLSLDTIGYQHPKVPSFGGINSFIFQNIMSSAHPLPEYGTPHLFTYLVSVAVVPGVKHRISLIRIKSTDDREVVAQWSVDIHEVPYMHSFSVTPNYVIFFSPPLFVNTKALLPTAFISNGLKWQGARKNMTIHVIEIRTGIVRTFSAPPIFYMHHINAYETWTKEIIIDLPTYPDASLIFDLNMETLLNRSERNKLNPHSILTRYGINLNRTQVSVKSFPESARYPCVTKFDMPVINEVYRSRNYCYVYGMVPKCDDTQYSYIALVKKDLCGNGKDRMWFYRYHYPAEMWFIPFPTDNESKPKEDDGFLLVPVLDGEKNASYLAVIDAVSMTTAHKANLPTRVPMTFHGRFFHSIK
ncbi:carotenoid isomerooxygenase-like [Ylistrum balloti]|uniref:carotenoid isomerooxygenase-like n=1 Tax=Ylistrum balloti TaxID=509963 RepID=UPI002905F01A|nr:carotenoid isomerooxygenase-like [Ylistrum balloti]